MELAVQIRDMKDQVQDENNYHDGEKKQIVAAFIVSLSMVMHGFVNGWTSPSLPKLMSADSPVPLTATQLSWMMSAANLGAMLGPLPSAFLMNRLGRRGALLLLNLLPALAWLLTYCASSFPLLLAARVMAGTWVGITFTILPNYISEMVEPKLRSSMLTLPNFLQKCGTLTVFAIGNLISYSNLSILGFFLALCYFLVLMVVPESPYFSIQVNKHTNAIQSLVWLHGNDIAHTKFLKLKEFVQEDTDTKQSLKTLLKNSKQLWNIVKVTTASLLMVTSGGTIIVIFPFLIPERAFFSLTNKECTIIGAVVNVMFSFRPKCLSPYGNKPSLIVSALVCGTCMATMTTWHYYQESYSILTTKLHWVPFISYLVHIMFFSLYMQPIVTALRGEMFPTKHKANCAAFITVLTSFAVYAALYSFIPIKELVGVYVNFLIASVSCFSLALFTYFFLIETEGKTLQEIQKELNDT